MWTCKALTAAILFLLAANANAITVEELIAKNIQARGGLERIKAVKSIRATGTVRFGSVDAFITHMVKRPRMLRDEFSLQGLTAVNAYDGSTGWRISPFQGRMDPEKMSEDELKPMQIDADIEGPL